MKHEKNPPRRLKTDSGRPAANCRAETGKDLYSVSETEKPDKKKKNRLTDRAKRTIAGVAAGAMILVGGFSAFGSVYLLDLLDKLTYANPNDDATPDIDFTLPTEETNPNDIGEVSPIDLFNYIRDLAKIPMKGNQDDVTNILLLGIDGTRSKQGVSYVGLSDTMVIMSINDKTDTVKLVSLLRDTAVVYPGRDNNKDGYDDYGKLNAAYAYGGYQLLLKTIQANFRLRIDHFLAVNFNAFSTAIDALDGVTITLTAREAQHIKVGKTAGDYHLNGAKALEFSRIRKLDSDFGRTRRQRDMLNAVFTEVKGMGLLKMDRFARQIFPQSYTNMSQNQITDYVINSQSYLDYDFQHDRSIPPSAGYKTEYVGKTLPGGGSSLLLTDPVKTITELHEYLYGYV